LTITIRLPTGAVVGMSLAATIAAAAIMTRQHQQRRRIPGDPTQPQPAPQLPATAAYLERLHNEFSAHRAQDGSSSAHGGVESSAPGSPHEHEPARLVVGVDPNGDNEVDLNLPAICMLTLSGPTAADVARYLAVALVGNDKPRCLYQHLIEIVIPEHDLEALVGPPGNDLTLPRCIHVVTDLPAALSRLEAELVYRTRLLDERGLSNTRQLRTAALDGTDDGEWIGTLTLLAQPGPEFATRLETILRAGQHLDVTAILISDRPVTQLGQTWSVDSEGRVADTSPPASAVPLGTQLYRLDKKAARDVISTLAAAHGESPPNRPVEPSPSSNPTHIPSTPPATQSQQAPAAADEESLAKAGIKGHGRAAHQSATPSEPPAAITVLGQPHIDVHGQHVSTGLRSHALELAVLLALHPEGITRDRILDTIWSTEPLSSAQQGFAAARANLRHVLRDSTKLHEHEFVVRRGKTYSLDARLIKADLREIEEQLSQVAEAGTEKERLDALLALAAREYRPIADGSQYPWIEPYRQALADQLADAHVELASRLETDRPREAAAAYQRALTCNPLNEETYRRLMRLQAELGDRDALSRTWRECQRRLALIDVDPDEETKRTADYLLKRLT
jgi:DNA-binding SARP family transcriptional activator